LSLSADARFKGWFAGFWLVSWFGVVKSWHAIEYAILTTLGWRALTAHTGWPIRGCAAAAWGCAVLFAASDEWHQTFVPGRGGNLLDVGIDTLGASVAVAIILLGERKRRKEVLTTHEHPLPEPDRDPRG
jgi:VanZ family protein